MSSMIGKLKRYPPPVLRVEKRRDTGIKRCPGCGQAPDYLYLKRVSKHGDEVILGACCKKFSVPRVSISVANDWNNYAMPPDNRAT